MSRNYVNLELLVQLDSSGFGKLDKGQRSQSTGRVSLPTPPPVPPRLSVPPKVPKRAFKQSKKYSEKCQSFGGIPTLDEQSLSDIDVFDSNYDCGDAFSSHYISVDSYSYHYSDDEFVSFNDSDVTNSEVSLFVGHQKFYTNPNREARIQKSKSYHSQVSNCAENWENLRNLKIKDQIDSYEGNEGLIPEKESAHMPPKSRASGKKWFKRHSYGAHMTSRDYHHRAEHHIYSRMNSNSEVGCSTPTAAGRLLHGGYSSCEDEDEDDEFYLRFNSAERSEVNVMSPGSEDNRGESSSCSDSLMSQRTFSSLNQSVYDFETPQTSKCAASSDWMPGTAISYAPESFSLEKQQLELSQPQLAPRVLFQESNNYGNFGVACKTGWLEVKHLLALKKRKLEPVAKRKFRRFWCCLKGTKLLFYTDISNASATPFNTISLDNCLVQPLPEHPRRDHVIVISTNLGDVFMVQCVSYADMHAWTNTIHKVCGHSIALNKNSDDTVKLLKLDIERKEKLCMDSKQASTTEKYQCDIFRLKCYIASLRNEDLPNPKTLLCMASKDTKSHLSRLNCFSVCAVHALLTAQSVPQSKTQGSLERPKRTMFSLLRAKESFTSKEDSAKSRYLKRRGSTLAKPESQVSSLDDSIVCSPAAKDQLAVWDHQEKGKLARISLPRNQTSVIPVLPHTSIQDVLERCCRKRSLDPKDHFIRVKQFDQWIIPQPRSLLTNYTCEAVELCIKEYKAIELVKNVPTEPYGFSFEMRADLSYGGSRLFVLDVIPGSIAENGGIVTGDEIIEIDSLPVSSVDQNLIDFHLKKKEHLGLLLRSLRPSRYSNSTCEVCGKRKTSTNDHSASCDSGSSASNSTFYRLAKISDELFLTEKQYVNDLEMLINDYLTPIVKSKLVNYSEIHQIFSAAVNIQKVQKNFFTELRSVYPEHSSLEATSTSMESLAESLIPCMESLNRHVGSFKIYGTYCALHNKALEIFKEASLDAEFKQLLESNNPLNEQARNLQSFMIKPLQRILKYKLFIRQIADYYPSDLEGCATIEETFESVDKLGSHINEMQRVYEDFYSLFDQVLAEQDDSSLVTSLPLDQLLAHGPVTWVSNAFEENAVKKSKNCPMMMFVFKDAIVLLPNSRDKKRRKMSLVLQTNKEEFMTKQRFVLPTCTTTLVPHELNDDAELFSIDYTESSDLSQTALTHRFVLWCKDSACRRRLVSSIHSSCAPSTQMRKRNARKHNRDVSEIRKAQRESDLKYNYPQHNVQRQRAQQHSSVNQNARSQSSSPSRRNTQVDSGVFSDENDNATSTNVS